MGSSLNYLLDICLEGLRDIADASSRLDAFAIADRHFRRLGFHGFSFAERIPRVTIALEASYSSFWDQHHREEWLAAGMYMDSPSQRAMRARRDWIWNTRGDANDMRLKRLFSFLRGTPAKSGCAFALENALYGAASFTISADAFVNLEQRVIDGAKTLAHGLAMKAQQLADDDSLSRFDPDDLSERQLDVLRWVVCGKSNYEISVILNMTERNVVYHLSQIFKKINVLNRTQAAAWYLGSGRHASL